MDTKLPTKKPNKYVWTCDYCSKDFDTKRQSDKHEVGCSKNPNRKREVTVKFKIPKPSTIFYFLLVLFGVYFLSYLLINSYAKSNGLPKVSITNPLKWFEPTPTATPTPTLLPTPTITPTNATKPKIVCPVSEKCKGQDFTLKSGRCSDYICCQYPDGKYVVETIAKCEQIQAQPQTQQQANQTNNQEIKYEQVVIPHLGKTYYCDTRYIAGVLKTSNDFVDLRNRALNNANDLGARWGAVCSMKPQSEQEQCLKDSGVYETAKKFDEILNEQEKKVMAVINYACKQQ